MNTELWSKSTKSIFTGVLLYSIAGVVYPIFDYINSLAETASSAASFMSSAAGGPKVDVEFSGLAVVCYVLLAAIIFGYFLYLKGLGSFEQAVEPADAPSVKKVKTATVLVLIGMAAILIFDLIGLEGTGSFIGGALNIIAYILMLLGFSALKKSSTFPEFAQKGANMLFISLILLLCGTVLGWIPFIGGVLEIIASVAAYILIFVGWSKIKNIQAA